MDESEDFEQYQREMQAFEEAGGPSFLEEMAIMKYATFEAYLNAGFSDRQALYLLAMEDVMVEPPDADEY